MNKIKKLNIGSSYTLYFIFQFDCFFENNFLTQSMIMDK